MKPHAYLFTDGSAADGDDIGGWAGITISADKRKLLYGMEQPTSISRCELKPIVEGLRWIKANWANVPAYRVLVISDSEYTVKTLCGVYEGKKNRDLWAAWKNVVEGMNVKYIWRERNSHPYMELCDTIAGGLRKHMHERMGLLSADIRNPEAEIPVYPLPEGLAETYDWRNGMP